MKNKQKITLFLLLFCFFSFEKIKAEVPKTALKTSSKSTEVKKSAGENKSTESKKQNSSYLKALKKNKSHKKTKEAIKPPKTEPLQPSETKKTVKKEKVSEKESMKKKSHVPKVSEIKTQANDVKKPDESNKAENIKKTEVSSQKISSFLSQKRKGVRVLKIKKGSLFEELGLKKNDIILKINGMFFENSRHFIKHLKKIKKKSSFAITVIRDNKNLVLNYIVEKDPVSSKYKYSLKKISLQKEKEEGKDILEEYSHLFQQAYVQHPGGSLVYEKPSFDSKQIYVIPFGEQIVISKKILKPKREIGTFYKIFIKKPQKIAGYISQIEVLPQIIKRGNKYISNPEYGLWKKKMKQNSLMDSHGIFPPSFSESAEEKVGEKKVKSSRFAGVSLGASFESQEKFTDRLQFGLKLSGYDLLVSYINMDINFLFDPNWDNMSIDIIGEYIFLKAGSFKAGPALGLNTNLQFKDQGIRLDMVIALSSSLPLTESLIWRNDIRFKGFFNKPVIPYFLTALQWGF